MIETTASAERCVCSFLRLPRCQSPQEEAAYLKQHQRWLLHCNVVLIVLMVLSHVGMLLQSLRTEGQRPDQPFAWDVLDARLPTYVWWVVAICLGVFAIACICIAKLMQPEWATNVAEYSFAALSVAICVGSPLLNRWRGPILLGADPREIWIHTPESAEITTIAFVLTQIVAFSVLALRCSTVLVHHLIVALANVMIRVFLHSPFPGTDRWINVMVTIVAGCSFTSTYRIESFTRQSWMAMRASQTAAEGSQTELIRQQATTDAIRSVLRVLFDVVLQTGNTFTLTGQNCNFRGVFGEIGNSEWRGMRLTDFLAPDDRARLLDVARNATALNVPQLMTGTLMSSSGEQFQQAEILMADTQLGGDNKYLVGLRFPPLPFDNEVDRLPNDHNDHERQGQRQIVHSVPTATGLGRQGRRRALAEIMVQGADPPMQGEPDFSNTASDCTPSRPWIPFNTNRGSSEESEVVAIVNSMTQDYKIIACSAAFADLYEPSAVGHAFLPWVVEQNEFASWLEHETNGLLYAGDYVSTSPGIQITLRPPSGSARGIEYRVCVKVALEAIDSTAEPEEQCILVRVIVERVRWRPTQDRESELKRCCL